MKLKKFTKRFDEHLKDSRTVNVYEDDGPLFCGKLSEIPDEILNMKVDTWCDMLEVDTRVNQDLIDEDQETVKINMYLYIRVK